MNKLLVIGPILWILILWGGSIIHNPFGPWFVMASMFSAPIFYKIYQFSQGTQNGNFAADYGMPILFFIVIVILTIIMF